jgi:predicted porin
MNKHPLALAVLVGLAGAAHAQSSVTVYGVIDLNLYHKQLAGESAPTKIESGGMTTSHFGFRGNEDLGGGMSAIFNLSSFIRADGGGAGRSDTDAFWSRMSWVGLQSGYGTVKLGRQGTENFVQSIRFSPFSDSMAFGPIMLHTFMPSATQPMMTSSGSSTAGDFAWNNSLSYTSPNFSGAVGTVMASLGEGTPAGRRLGGSLYYAGGPLAATLVIEKIEKASLNFSKPPASIPMTDSKLVHAGASYDLTAVKLFGQYIRTKLNNATTEITLATKQLGVSAPVGSGRVLAAWTRTDKTQTAVANQKRDTVSLGYDYDLSKRTDLYAVVLNDKVTGLSGGTGFAVGLRHRF